VTEEAIDKLYGALLWISEYPNRDNIEGVNDDAVELAEFARVALEEFDAASSGAVVSGTPGED
jgi:hypothetical protein